MIKSILHKRRNPIFAFAGVLMLFTQADVNHAAVIRFRNEAKANSTVVTLADIAEIRDADPKTTERLSRIVLSPTPASGAQLRLDFATIRSRLQSHGVDLSRTEFTGSSLVLVSAGERAGVGRTGFGGRMREVPPWKQKRAAKLVSEAIQQYINRIAPELGQTDVTVELKNENVEKVLLGSVTGYEIRGGSPPWNIPQSIEVRFLDRNERIHIVAVPCRITPQPRVLVAKYNLPRGHRIRPDDLITRQVAATGDAYSQLQDVLNNETTQMVRKDQPLMKSNIRVVPLVRTNEIVTLYARATGLTVKRQMKARSEGALGDTVKLVSLDGKQTVIARVVGPNEAEVGKAPIAQAPVSPYSVVPALNQQVQVQNGLAPVSSVSGSMHDYAPRRPQRPINQSYPSQYPQRRYPVQIPLRNVRPYEK